MKYIILLFFINALTVSQTEVFEEVLNIENPYDLRDPFKSPELGGGEDEVKKKTRFEGGIFTNESPGNHIPLEKLVVHAIVYSKANKKALVKAKGERSKKLYVLKEGMKIKRQDIVLKQILPKALLFVEEITNVYGQPEYVESVIPILQ